MKLGSPFRRRLFSTLVISIMLGSAPLTPVQAQDLGELRIATS